MERVNKFELPLRDFVTILNRLMEVPIDELARIEFGVNATSHPSEIFVAAVAREVSFYRWGRP